jgi:hypothetical protein
MINGFSFAAETNSVVRHEAFSLEVKSVLAWYIYREKSVYYLCGSDYRAQIGFVTFTEHTSSALWNVKWDNVITWGNRGYAFAHRLDNATAFMPYKFD